MRFIVIAIFFTLLCFSYNLLFLTVSGGSHSGSSYMVEVAVYNFLVIPLIWIALYFFKYKCENGIFLFVFFCLVLSAVCVSSPFIFGWIEGNRLDSVRDSVNENRRNMSLYSLSDELLLNNDGASLGIEVNFSFFFPATLEMYPEVYLSGIENGEYLHFYVASCRINDLPGRVVKYTNSCRPLSSGDRYSYGQKYEITMVLYPTCNDFDSSLDSFSDEYLWVNIIFKNDKRVVVKASSNKTIQVYSSAELFRSCRK